MHSFFRLLTAKRSALILTTVLIASMAAYLVWPSPPRGPIYEGHPLSYWLRYDSTQPGSFRTTKAREALAASRIEGTAWLIWALENGEFADQHAWPFRLRSWLHAKVPLFPRPMFYDDRLVAWSHIRSMQPPPKAAIPPLFRMLQSKEAIIAQAGADALFRLQPTSYPALIETSRNGPPSKRALAVSSLHRGQTQPYYLPPYISSEPETAQVVDALLVALHDADEEVRCQAIASLRSYHPLQGPTLEVAKMAIAQATQDPESRVRQDATLALNAISEAAVSGDGH